MEHRNFVTDYYAVRATVPKGHTVHHTASSWEKLIFLISGSGTFTSKGYTVTVNASDILYVPAKTEYSTVWNCDTEFCSIGFQMTSPLVNTAPEQLLKLPSNIYGFFGEYFIGLETILDERSAGYHYRFLSTLYEQFGEIESIHSGHMQTNTFRESIAYLKRNCQKPVDANRLAKMSGMSVSTYYRKFRKETGQSVMEYRNSELIRRAAVLLDIGELNVGQIAEALGFDDISCFSRLFKRLMGVSPMSYKNRHH